MWSCSVEPVKPSRQVGVARFGRGVGDAVGPSAQNGLYEPLAFAVSLRGVAPGEDMADCEKAQGLGAASGAISAAIVGLDTLSLDTLSPQLAQGAQQKTSGGLLAFVLQHLDIGQPVRIFDGEMYEVSA
jgi:hypothetical protein